MHLSVTLSMLKIFDGTKPKIDTLTAGPPSFRGRGQCQIITKPRDLKETLSPEGTSHYALCSCVAAAMLAACGGSQPPIGAPGAMPQMRASTGYSLLYSFGAGSDGRTPKAGLTELHGVLYGTT